MKISIPKPCQENWNAMLPEDQGRFCLKCTKTVVDFTAKSKEEIKDFFREAGGKVCGRFSSDQLGKTAKPLPAFVSYPAKRIGQFAWALYLVFGALLFSCSDKTVGKIEYIKGDVVEMPEMPDTGKVQCAPGAKGDHPGGYGFCAAGDDKRRGEAGEIRTFRN